MRQCSCCTWSEVSSPEGRKEEVGIGKQYQFVENTEGKVRSCGEDGAMEVTVLIWVGFGVIGP